MIQRQSPVSRLAAGVVLLFALAACNSPKDSAVPAPPAPLPRQSVPVTKAPQIVTRAGGTVSGPDGASLTVPPGAVTRDTVGWIKRAGAGYDIHLDGRFRGTLLVAVPVKSVAGGTMPYLTHRTKQGVVVEEATRVGNFLVAEVRSLSFFKVIKCLRSKSKVVRCLLNEGVKRIPNSLFKKILHLLGPEDCPLQLDVIDLITDPCKVGETQADIDRWNAQQNAGSGGSNGQNAPPPAPPNNPPPPPPNNPPPPPSDPPPPPPGPSVSINTGASAVGQPGCSHSSCAFIVVNLANFGGGSHHVTCHASNGDEGGYYAYDTSSSSSAVCYYGYPGRTVWVYVDGVRSHDLVW